MKGRYIDAFPIKIGIWSIIESELYELLYDLVQRVPDLSAEQNLAIKNDVATSYSAQQCRFKLYQEKKDIYEYTDDLFKLKKDIIISTLNNIADDYLISCFPEITGEQLMLQDMWMVKYKEGDYNIYHTHPESSLSGVLFLDVPPSINESTFPDGHLHFLNDGIYDEHTFRHKNKSLFQAPKPGELLVFPSSLGHEVYPFKGPGIRSTLAFNWIRNKVYYGNFL